MFRLIGFLVLTLILPCNAGVALVGVSPSSSSGSSSSSSGGGDVYVPPPTIGESLEGYFRPLKFCISGCKAYIKAYDVKAMDAETTESCRRDCKKIQEYKKRKHRKNRKF